MKPQRERQDREAPQPVGKRSTAPHPVGQQSTGPQPVGPRAIANRPVLQQPVVRQPVSRQPAPPPPVGQPIDTLNGLGPKSREMLALAGIQTVTQLRELGAVEAFVRTRRVNARASLNLLWALEAALTGERWQTVARAHRTSLLFAVDERLRRGD